MKHAIRHRASTIDWYNESVKRVIAVMREEIRRPLSLVQMADIAALSPYHFSRIFRHITGVSPRKFQSALRIEHARHLLSSTGMSITEICFDLNYESLGSFTTSFTEFVGVQPSKVRKIVGLDSGVFNEGFGYAHSIHATSSDEETNMVSVVGQAYASDELLGGVMLGLFHTPVPGGHPIACTALPREGNFAIYGVPAGEYFLLAAGCSRPLAMRECLLQGGKTLYIGSTQLSIQGQENSTKVRANIELRQWKYTDPPFIWLLPLVSMA